MAAGVVGGVPSSSNGSVTSKGSTSTTSNKSKSKKSLYKKLFKKKKKHHASDGASLASIQEEIPPTTSSNRVNNYPPSTVTTKSPVGNKSNGNAEQNRNGNNSSNNDVNVSNHSDHGQQHPQPQSSLLPSNQHNFDDITQTPFGCFEHGGIITRLHSTVEGNGGMAGAPAPPTATPSLAVETSLKVHKNNATSSAAAAAAVTTTPNTTAAAVPMTTTTTTNVNQEETNLLAQHSLETIHICNTSSSEADNVSALPTPSPFRSDKNNDHVSSTMSNTHPPSIRNTSSNISALTEDPTGFYDSSVVSSSVASTANRSSLASFFGGTFSFASTTGSAASQSVPVTPSPARRTKALLKMNVLPTISDSGSASSPLSPNYHVLSQQKHSTLEHSPLSSSEYSPSTSPSPIIEHSKASLLKQEALKQALEDAHVSSEGNFITRSKHFRKLVDWAFEQIDSDSTGQVDQQELYTGLLLIHLELAKYVGAAACRPMSRAQVYELFEKLDVDHSGTLSKEEFQSVMTILCSQLLTRVITLFGSTILLVPLLTRAIVDGTTHIWSLEEFIRKRQQFMKVCQTIIWPKIVTYSKVTYNTLDHGWNVTSTQISNLTNYTIPNLSTTQTVLKQTSTNLWNQIIRMSQQYTPTFVIKAYSKMLALYETHVVPNIPDDLQETLPYAIVSCILASLLVPYMLVKIDNFFASLANKKSTQTKKTTTTR